LFSSIAILHRSSSCLISRQITFCRRTYWTFLGFKAEKLEAMSTLQQQRLIVEQLRREAAIRRINVSQAVEDIKKYIGDHEQEDYLLIGFSSQKANPFREKSSCTLI